MRKSKHSSIRAQLTELSLLGTIALGASIVGTAVASAQQAQFVGTVEVQTTPVQTVQPVQVVEPVRPVRSFGGPRLRLGLEVGGGGAWGRPRGPAIAGFGQLGIQLTDRFAIFYQPSLLAHSLGRADNADVFLAWGNLGMIDFSMGMVQFGIGGGADIGKFASCDSQTDCVAGDRTVNPAIGGRLALVLPLGRHRGAMGTRIAIPVAFHVHSTFIDADQRLTALVLTLGVQMY